MDIYYNYSGSDPTPCGSDFWSHDVLESSSVSESGSPGGIANHSDEEVMLASNHPKKRAGRKKFRETRHPVYRGVRRRNSGKWVCEVREPNKKTRIWLGTFPTVEMAARAHDVAAISLRGRSACLNFADSAWRLPVPASGDAKDIQRAAAEAAEAFRPTEAVEVSAGKAKEESNGTSFGENVYFMDEDPDFLMPELLADMAEGLMLPPPHFSGQDYNGDDVEANADMSLWSY